MLRKTYPAKKIFDGKTYDYVITAGHAGHLKKELGFIKDSGYISAVLHEPSINDSFERWVIYKRKPTKEDENWFEGLMSFLNW
jgi:hypothetical protein